jgi:GNAT superfamily N-acetyltransferase
MAAASDLKIEIIRQGHPGLPAFFHSLPGDSGWPPGTVLSLSDREPTEFENAERFVAALQGERVLGLISLHSGEPGNYHRRHNLRLHVDVLPAWRSRGIGTAMMHELLALARREGYLRIHLATLSWNQPALALFGRFGFRVAGTSRAAYQVKTESGEEYFLDGVGMSLWIGPALEAGPVAGSLRVVGAGSEAAAGPGARAAGSHRTMAPSAGDIVCRREDVVLSEELMSLYEAAGDPRHRFPAILKGAWSHSWPVVTARRASRLVGAARGIADRHSTLYVCDLLVEPASRRQGIGSRLMLELIEPYRNRCRIILLAEPEALSFCEKLGFTQRHEACLTMDPPGGSSGDAPGG